jgi:hypothetical protein
MRPILVALLLLGALPAAAQVQSRPTDPPLVTAENESWYQFREPIQFAGDLYYPAGPVVFFNGNTMVRTGHYNGVLLYADTTVEPFSIVLVPVRRGLMQPYERLRRGDLAGTTGSRAPSFPVSLAPTTPLTAVAAIAPTALPLPLGAIGVYTPESRAVSPAIAVAQPPRSNAGVTETSIRTLAASPSPAAAMASIRRPENNDGIWIRFANKKWASAGPAVPLSSGEFRRIGEYAGGPVYRRNASDDVIYVPTIDALVAPFRLKE